MANSEEYIPDIDFRIGKLTKGSIEITMKSNDRSLVIPSSSKRIEHAISKLNNLLAEYAVIASSDNQSNRLPERIVADLEHIKRYLSFGDDERLTTFNEFEKLKEKYQDKSQFHHGGIAHKTQNMGAGSVAPPKSWNAGTSAAKIGGILNTSAGPKKFLR